MKCLFVILFVCHVNLLFVSATECAAEAEQNEHTVAFAATAEPMSEVPSAADVVQSKLPTILIVTLFRNKAHTMPYFFTYLDRLTYPKDRISLWLVEMCIQKIS